MLDCLSKISASSGGDDDRELPLQRRELLGLLVQLSEYSKQLPPVSPVLGPGQAAGVHSAFLKVPASGMGDVSLKV